MFHENESCEKCFHLFYFIIIVCSRVKQSIGLLSLSTDCQNCGIGIGSEKVGHPESKPKTYITEPKLSVFHLFHFLSFIL